MKILVVDDDQAIREIVRRTLVDAGFDVTVAADGSEAIEIGRSDAFDMIISDVVMRNVDGFEVLRAFREELQPDADVVLMTGQATLDAALSAIRAGARDYLAKPFSLDQLIEIVRTSEERRRLIQEERNGSAEPAVEFADVIGTSPVMVSVFKSVGRVAPTDLPVLICGESGTGKEVIARRLHANSGRGNRPFVAVNCGALTETLLESELFGHRRGSFTGAHADHRGLFEEADGGTIFLDEITETSPAFQVKVLRVLQEGEVRRVGSNTPIKIDVRVLSASNRDPAALAAEGLFRADLLYRLNSVTLWLPPLRDRGDDLDAMIDAFLARYTPEHLPNVRIAPEARELLRRYPWPGNVRELRSTIQRLALINSGGFVQVSDLPARIRTHESAAESAPKDASGAPFGFQEAAGGEPLTLAEVERRHLVRVLAYTEGNKRQAARVLGVDRKRLGRMIERHGVNIDEFRSGDGPLDDDSDED